MTTIRRHEDRQLAAAQLGGVRQDASGWGVPQLGTPGWNRWTARPSAGFRRRVLIFVDRGRR